MAVRRLAGSGSFGLMAWSAAAILWPQRKMRSARTCSCSNSASNARPLSVFVVGSFVISAERNSPPGGNGFWLGGAPPPSDRAPPVVFLGGRFRDQRGGNPSAGRDRLALRAHPRRFRAEAFRKILAAKQGLGRFDAEELRGFLVDRRIGFVDARFMVD